MRARGGRFGRAFRLWPGPGEVEINSEVTLAVNDRGDAVAGWGRSTGNVEYVELRIRRR